MPKIESRKSEYAVRVQSPKKLDKHSIRTKQIGKGKSIIVGCPVGKYDHKKEKCKVGTQTQAYRFKKRQHSKDDVRSFAKRHGL